MLSIFDNGPSTPCPASFNMAAYVLSQAETHKNKVALEIVGTSAQSTTTRWTFSELSQAVASLAYGFTQSGLNQGDRILFRLGNSAETPIAYLAAIWAGFIPVPTSPLLTLSETSKIIAFLKPSMILHEAPIPCPDTPGRISKEQMNRLMHMGEMPPVPGDPDRAAYMVFTSGTSGSPRAVEHAHRAIWARRMMHKDWYALRPTDRLMHAGAFNWTFTMGTGLMDPWSIGATALIPAPDTLPQDLLCLAAQKEATIFAAAPGVIRKLCKSNADVDLPHLRHGLSAGEKLGRDTRDAWRTCTGTDLHEAFGMSECSTFLSGNPALPAEQETLGRPQTGRRVAIVDKTGTPVEIGTPGIIAVHSSDPGLMRGYFDETGSVHVPMFQDWFLTGDQGTMDQNGNISCLGRADDMMNAGGYRVSPIEVEMAFANFPGIETIAVSDIIVKQDVRVIMAFYTALHEVAAEELAQYAAQHLASYKCPREFVHVRELPTGPNGKLARKNLQLLWNAQNGQT